MLLIRLFIDLKIVNPLIPLFVIPKLPMPNNCHSSVLTIDVEITSHLQKSAFDKFTALLHAFVSLRIANADPKFYAYILSGRLHTHSSVSVHKSTIERAL